MRFYLKEHKYYCGIDLHAKNMYVCILNASGEIKVHQNIKTTKEDFLSIISPYREDLVVCVECMFTWYWLADVCAAENIRFVLGHALYMKAIHGGKAKNDRIDSKKISVILRGGMIPQAYVYPVKMRATRDLLRRRNHFMRKRAELYAHIQNTRSQYNLPETIGCIAKTRDRQVIADKFTERSVKKSIEANLSMIESYDKVLSQMEWEIEKSAMNHDPVSFTILKTVPGIGKILGLVILYEIENINRFPSVQQFASYARLVKCKKESNGKMSGTGGKKIGNAHLKWAFGEAAALFLKGNEKGKKMKQRLVNKHGKAKALSIIAHKLGRSVYFMLKNKEAFSPAMFYRD